MSTRASIIIKDENHTLYFYRHSDGYPDCCGKDLSEFVKGYSTFMRNNATQSAGHLIIRGYLEYADMRNTPGYQWKVGAYEPTSSLHPDVEYIYVIDLTKGTLETYQPDSDYWDSPELYNTHLISQFKFKMAG